MWPYPKMPTVRGCKFHAPVSFAVPLPCLHRGIGLTQEVHQGQEHAEGVFSHSVTVAFGAVEDLDAPAKADARSMFSRPAPERHMKRRCGQSVKQFGIDTNAAPQHNACGVIVGIDGLRRGV